MEEGAASVYAAGPARPRLFAGKHPSSWRECRKLKVAELKSLCHDLQLPVQGRKDDLLDRVCDALIISKSGTCGVEAKPERYAASSFDRNTQQQYEALRKLSSVGGQWKKDLSSVPTSFGLEAIKTYLIESPDKTFDRQSVRAYKSLGAWSLSQGGHVIMMDINPNCQGSVFMFLRAYCLPSQSTTHAYPVHICLDKHTGTVYGAECRCVAGLGECCSHVAGALFRLEDLLSQGATVVPEDTACTEKSCSWVVPANAAKVQPQPLDEVIVYKPVIGKARPSTEGPSLATFHPVPPPTVKTNAERAGELVARLRGNDATPSCPFAVMYEAQLYVESAAADDTTIVPEFEDSPAEIGMWQLAPSREVTIETTEELSCKFDTVDEATVAAFVRLRGSVDTEHCRPEAEEKLLDSLASISAQSAKKIEQDTRGQNLNNTWFYERVGRISSSRSHQIGHLRNTTDPGTVLNTIFGCTNRGSVSPAPMPPVSAAPLSHGQRMEPVARRCYIQHMKAKGTPVSVATCGLFVSSTHPWLASSPDGLIADNSTADKFGVLEIKCPFSNEPVHRLMAQSASFCLQEMEGQIQLRRQHQYFTQVQHHMAVVGRRWCDFVAFTKDHSSSAESILVVRVNQDAAFWSEHFIKLEKFFQSVIVPNAVDSAFSLLSIP